MIATMATSRMNLTHLALTFDVDGRDAEEDAVVVVIRKDSTIPPPPDTSSPKTNFSLPPLALLPS